MEIEKPSAANEGQYVRHRVWGAKWVVGPGQEVEAGQISIILDEEITVEVGYTGALVVDVFLHAEVGYWP